ncbi:nitroreductase family protein [Alicyclobacillus fastidiosus]|uniref:Nitroreductase family protein n=1 Tax=Alicyclobacillus fastidiosus TaxID=392011 RepID=A0ABY6ZGY7_9BACL|nr:nitroreductase family protein [Alicyclobacillus fastidiosus]WAH41481.1 nitroreductase family protein [Alicyclobacillus fastidiosus]GMA63123.1 nitroreductase [Alicyclobacillus fastidiosus]
MSFATEHMGVKSTCFADAVTGRRSIRKLKRHASVNQAQIDKIVRIVVNAPSAYNMQSGRLVVLMDDEHEALWDLAKETYAKLIPQEKVASFMERLDGFRRGNGTVLFFEDEETIRRMQEKIPANKDAFVDWSHHGSGMLQFAMWTALCADGIAASLQHVNAIEQQVKERYHISPSWKMIAQMPFGASDEEPVEKSTLDYADVVKFY